MKKTTNTTTRVDTDLLRELWNDGQDSDQNRDRQWPPATVVAAVAAPVETATQVHDPAQPNHNNYVKITTSVLANGSRSVQSTHRKRETAQSASGKTYGYWRSVSTEQIIRTGKGLIVHRTFIDKGGVSSEHIFDDVALKNLVDLLVGRPIKAFSYRDVYNFESTSEQRAQAQALQIARTAEIVAQVLAHLGDAPDPAERFPLLAGIQSQAGIPLSWNKMPRFAHSYMPYLDAQNYAELAKNLFGQRAYKKPMAGCVEKLDAVSLGWFALFRGLVPSEWIIDAMRAHEGKLPYEISPNKARVIRRILVRTPQPVLRRILSQRAALAQRPLTDVVLAIANKHVQMVDLDQLPAVIAARGQKHVRDAAGLEHLIRGLVSDPVPLKSQRRRAAANTRIMREHEIRDTLNQYNRAAQTANWELVTWEQAQDATLRETMEAKLVDYRREQLTIQQRERAVRDEERRLERLAANVKRAAWASETEQLLQGTVLAGLSLTVATNPDQLREWGATMANCIGGYGSELGLDVFCAFTDPATEKMLVNAQISWKNGVLQLLGKHNAELVKKLGQEQAQQLVNELAALGFLVYRDTWGVDGLQIPELCDSQPRG